MKISDDQRRLELIIKAGSSPLGTLYLPICTKIARGHVPAGLILSEIIYWYRPTEDGQSKLKVSRYDKKTRTTKTFLAKTNRDLQDKLGLSLEKVKKAKTILKELGLVTIEHHKFSGANTSHYRLEIDRLIQLWHAANKQDPDEDSSTVIQPRRPISSGPGAVENVVEKLVENLCASPRWVTPFGGKATAGIVEKPQLHGVAEIPPNLNRDSQRINKKITLSSEAPDSRGKPANRICQNAECGHRFTPSVISELVRKNMGTCPKCNTPLPAVLIKEIQHFATESSCW